MESCDLYFYSSYTSDIIKCFLISVVRSSEWLQKHGRGEQIVCVSGCTRVYTCRKISLKMKGSCSCCSQLSQPYLAYMVKNNRQNKKKSTDFLLWIWTAQGAAMLVCSISMKSMKRLSLSYLLLLPHFVTDFIFLATLFSFQLCPWHHW